MTIFAVTYRYSDDVATRDNLRTEHRDYLRGLERVPRILRAGCGRPGGCCIAMI